MYFYPIKDPHAKETGTDYHSSSRTGPDTTAFTIPAKEWEGGQGRRKAGPAATCPRVSGTGISAAPLHAGQGQEKNWSTQHLVRNPQQAHTYTIPEVICMLLLPNVTSSKKTQTTQSMETTPTASHQSICFLHSTFLTTLEKKLKIRVKWQLQLSWTEIITTKDVSKNSNMLVNHLCSYLLLYFHQLFTFYYNFIFSLITKPPSTF